MTAHSLLITRPAGKADGLLASLDQLGYQYLYQPLIATQLVPIKAKEQQWLQQADQLIFVSVSAVTSLQQQLDASTLAAPLRAVGHTTATVLQQWTGREVLYPDDQRSEGVLSMPCMQQVDGQNIVIVRGQSGRELMKQGLQQRGARVRYVQSYHRLPIELDGCALYALWQQQVSCILVTSEEIMRRLFSLLPVEGHDWLRSRYWILVSPRMHDAALTLGIPVSKIILADNANDSALMAAIGHYKRGYL
ncbi:uroporphyrinogen-III synthase [Alkalimonas delamerensis]|uniref:Uroporphyrinogen-III synthase n=1 Tax=Alkalimonas delamerensis TaxID=265981 RepID=A0ABT9GTD4_9GAMM|nr:uroporphyrinogen-III synthase [Alkalimonas delamerensis]MDP4530240.1 uroporphyrinogen-III synthase [Alkalimonas delamerensis]